MRPGRALVGLKTPVNSPAPTRLVPLVPMMGAKTHSAPYQAPEGAVLPPVNTGPPPPPPRIPGLGRPETMHEHWFSRAITWLLGRGEG